MKAHLKGEFIAVIDVGDFTPMDNYPTTDDGRQRLLRKWHRNAVARVDELLAELGEKHEITIVMMPEFVDGAPVEI
jgi:hypothetical protein